MYAIKRCYKAQMYKEKIENRDYRIGKIQIMSLK